MLCARRLEATAPKLREAAPEPATVAPGATRESGGMGGGWLAGVALVLRSPYLGGIALWVSLLSLAGTFLYFQQASIVAAASDDPAVRTRIFATIDLAIGNFLYHSSDRAIAIWKNQGPRPLANGRR